MPQGAKGRQPIVAVPVRDEAERLPDLVEALARQTWISRTGRVLQIVFALNNCRDDSAIIVKAASARQRGLAVKIKDVYIPPEHAHVGTARRNWLAWTLWALKRLNFRSAQARSV